MSVSFRFTFILLTGFMLSENIFSTTMSTDSPVVSDFLKKSSIYISHNDFDSAGFCIENARSAGMSKDSLFYLFSELYIQKSVFDTALAFNYAIITTKNDSMYSKKFEQRYLIYSMLNLKSEADKAMDSLGLNNVSQSSNLYIPRFSVGLNSGYKNDRTFTPEFDPGDNQFTMQSLHTNGYSGNINSSINWELPWPGDRLFTAGAEYRGNKSSDQKAFKSDSLAHSWSAMLRLNDFHHYYISYIFSRIKNQLNTYSSSNALQLSWIRPVSNSTNTIGLSFTGELSTSHSKIIGQRYSLYSFHEKTLSKMASIGFSVFAYSLIRENDVLMYTAKIINIIGDHADPFFLTANNDTIKKPSSRHDNLEYRAKKDSNSVDTIILLQQIPNTILSISPSINNTLSLFLNIKLTTLIEWTFTYYTDCGKWKAPQDIPFVVRDITDNKIYRSDPADPKGGLDQKAISEITKRRIDNILTIAISAAHTVWRLGDFSIGGSVEKSYSTLSNNSPIEMPNWSWDISSTLTINFPFRK